VTDAQAQSGPFVSSLAGEERGKEALQILLRTRRAIISKGSHHNIPDRFNSNSQGTSFMHLNHKILGINNNVEE